MRKNQPAATETMEFQTSPMVLKGSSNWKNRCQAAEAEDAGRLAQLAGNGLERRVKAEGNVPDLSGEDEHDGAEFEAELASGEESDHGEHYAGKKAEHRDGLEDVQDGDHEGFDALVIGGDVAVGKGEGRLKT